MCIECQSAVLERQSRSREVTTANLKTNRLEGLCCTFRQHIHHAVHGIGAVDSTSRPLDDFHTARLKKVGVKQLIDVAEPRRSKVDAVLCSEKRTAGTGAG